MSNRANDAGFSIVEALVALFVFALAGVALMQLQTESLRTLSQVETRSLAQTLAQNRLVELAAANAKPDVGAREEEAEFAQRQWRVGTVIAATPDPGVRRATISVTEAAARAPAAVMHAFFEAPEAQP